MALPLKVKHSISLLYINSRLKFQLKNGHPHSFSPKYPQSCHYNKLLDEERCECRCKPQFAPDKAHCASQDYERTWDEDTCTCRCKPRVCVSGYYQDKNTCQCKQVESTCTAVAAGGASLNRYERKQRRISSRSQPFFIIISTDSSGSRFEEHFRTTTYNHITVEVFDRRSINMTALDVSFAIYPFVDI